MTESENWLDALAADARDADTYSPLALAFLGDALFELIVRTKIARDGNTQVNRMSKRCTALVNAGAQARMAAYLEPGLSPEEAAAFRRGRNAKPATLAKNAKPADYHMATALESLVGYLYLKGQASRAAKLVEAGVGWALGQGAASEVSE
ncbi:MAG: ribonuclease III [Lachnospiraceae bacterium]|nr:ribonuclease III [Lachnospiraceae bacterium]